MKSTYRITYCDCEKSTDITADSFGVDDNNVLHFFVGEPENGEEVAAFHHWLFVRKVDGETTGVAN